MSEIKYKRVLLKLSGEALAGDDVKGVNAEVLGKICDQVKNIVDLGVQVAIVVGGGNFWRGRYRTSNGKNNFRLYGNACNSNEWTCTSRFIRSKRVTHKTSNSYRNERNCRTIYKKKSIKTFRKRKSCNILLWNR